MSRAISNIVFILLNIICLTSSTTAEEKPHNVWKDLAPGETSRSTGEIQPYRPQDKPRITRVINIRKPTFMAYPAEKPNGSAVIILPGGGFGKVVPDLEGSEAALWLNKHGVTVFVLNYRTKVKKTDPGWKRALQDAQRMMALIRSQSEKWNIKKDRIGLLAFSAGGQVGARLLCDEGKLAYKKQDKIDAVSHCPDFAILVYPWNMYDAKKEALIDGMEVPKDCPPTFLVHTDNDRSTSLGSVLFYTGLKKHHIPAELHIYGNGGHGYGIRPRPNSQISTWTNHATHWLGRRGFLKK